ncbi:MAG: hypothetical protein AB7E36_06945 [Salinivirgaceae bacterium]
MPKITFPTSDQDRLVLLQKIGATAAQDQSKGLNYLSEETLQKVNTQLPGLQTAYSALAAKFSHRSQEAAERDGALSQLEVYVRDAWDGIKRRVRRNKEPAQVLALYKLPLSGDIPKITNREAWVEMAKSIILGDAEAVNQGYPAMTSPTSTEIQAMVDNALLESNQAVAADREYDTAQAAMEPLRTSVGELFKDVYAELQFNLRKLDAPSQRRIIKTYGFRYYYQPGEPAEPEITETTPEAE